MEVANRILANNEDFSNAGGYTPSEGEIAASAAITQQLLANKSAKDAAESQTGCHKPFLMIGKKKRSYEKCMDDNKARKQKLEDERNALIRQQNELLKAKAMMPTVRKKFFQTPVGVATAVIGSLALVSLGILSYVKFIKK
jgi:hypothetical protein